MAIEIPGWLAKLFNLMGLAGGAGWTNANEDTSKSVSNVYLAHATNTQPSTVDAKLHGTRATGAVRGAAGDAMTTVVEHPQGPINNLIDHNKGALTMAFLTGAVVPLGLTVYKIAKLVDGAVTVGEMAASAAVPGGAIAWPEQLAVGRIVQELIMNLLAKMLTG